MVPTSAPTISLISPGWASTASYSESTRRLRRGGITYNMLDLISCRELLKRVKRTCLFAISAPCQVMPCSHLQAADWAGIFLIAASPYLRCDMEATIQFGEKKWRQCWKCEAFWLRRSQEIVRIPVRGSLCLPSIPGGLFCHRLCAARHGRGRRQRVGQPSPTAVLLHPGTQLHQANMKTNSRPSSQLIFLCSRREKKNQSWQHNI